MVKLRTIFSAETFAVVGQAVAARRRMILVLAPIVAAAGLASGFAGVYSSNQKATPAAIAPAVTPEQRELLQITHAAVQTQTTDFTEARKINASLPFSSAPVKPASAFSIAVAAAADQARALDCLTQAIYYEAGFEPIEGRRAVAQVILNRMRHPAFPKSVCGVIYEGASRPSCQFSFACDGSLRRGPPSPAAWREARDIAAAALAGTVMANVGRATHYHTDYVAPYWAPRLTKITKIGAHIFYRWPGSWGEPGAFNGRYSGAERIFTPEPEIAAPILTIASIVAPPPAPVKIVDPTDRRAPEDQGGRLDVEKGWTLNIVLPTEMRSSLAGVASAQSGQSSAQSEKPGGEAGA